MNKTVIFVQKLKSTSNWVSRKDAILRVFFGGGGLPKLEVGVERGQARRGMSSRSFCAWIKRRKPTTFLQAEYLRPNCVAVVDKGGKGVEGEMWKFFSIRVFLPFVFPCLRMSYTQKNTESWNLFCLFRSRLTHKSKWYTYGAKNLFFRPGHPRWDQNLQFQPLIRVIGVCSETWR